MPPWMRRQGGTGIRLAVAALLHVAAIGFLLIDLHTTGRNMGERDGDREAISVDVIDAADLSTLTSTAMPPPIQPPLRPTQPDITQGGETDGQAKQPTEAQPPTPPSQAKDVFELFPTLAPTPGGAAKAQPKEKAAAKDKAGPRGGQLLDLTPPPITAMATIDAAGLTRPAGITRSGENDDFGRGVIRALRLTMPPPKGASARVTVRFFLNEKGNLEEVRVTHPSGDSDLDQTVAFAVKQSNFPIPPARSTTSDRTFIVTYLYR